MSTLPSAAARVAFAAEMVSSAVSMAFAAAMALYAPSCSERRPERRVERRGGVDAGLGRDRVLHGEAGADDEADRGDRAGGDDPLATGAATADAATGEVGVGAVEAFWACVHGRCRFA